MANNGPFTPRPARFGGIQNNVRSFLREMPSPSSLYSRSPNPNRKDEESPAPTIPSFRGFMSRNRGQPEPRPSANSSASHLPLHRQDTGVTTYSPVSQPAEWARHPADPAPAVLPDLRPSDHTTVVFEHNDIEPASREGHRRKHKKRRRRHHQSSWVRKHKKRSDGGVCFPLLHGPARIKALSCITSGLFLAVILTIYLTVAVSIKKIGQEVHVIFILTILGTTVFFVHSLIRLCVITFRPSRPRNRIPSIAGPEGFQPTVPIRVHLARDEEIAALREDGTVEESKLESLKAPPPAYGLWRCSVRVNPNLLHWQRVGSPADAEEPLPTTPPPASNDLDHTEVATEQSRSAPRPPSYASDDGVDYVVAAQPRNTVYLPGPTSEVHPAYRACI